MEIGDWTDGLLDWYHRDEPTPPLPDEALETAARKTCRVCIQNKPLEDFALATVNSDGHKNACRACIAVRDAERYENNREAVRARNAAYHAANPHRARERGARWRAANPERNAAQARRRRQRMKAAGVLSKVDKATLIDFYGECLACGATDFIEVDHVMALANGGGSE